METSGDPDVLGPLQLAWLGDAVWELHQRMRYSKRPARSKFLHNAVVSEVQARAQAQAIKDLQPHLSDLEKDLVRRGRNKAGRAPKNGDAATYAMATGFETIVGWLFLSDPQRLADLFDLLDQESKGIK